MGEERKGEPTPCPPGPHHSSASALSVLRLTSLEHRVRSLSALLHHITAPSSLAPASIDTQPLLRQPLPHTSNKLGIGLSGSGAGAEVLVVLLHGALVLSLVQLLRGGEEERRRGGDEEEEMR
eukprot:1520804-Rhodomonas_salina.1